MQSLYDQAHTVFAVMAFLLLLLVLINLGACLRDRTQRRRIKSLEWENGIMREALAQLGHKAISVPGRINGTLR